jgi:DNA-directed RNA polymerase specialized sigma24 family protein
MRSVLTADQFDALLYRLAPDRDAAAAAYVQLRRRLVSVFAYRACANPEELADEAMDRLARKLLEGPQSISNPQGLLFAMAWKIMQESFRQPRSVDLPDEWEKTETYQPPPPPEEDDGRGQDCLESCLGWLTDGDRSVILAYFEHEKRAKISHRMEIAKELGISANALRLKVHRIIVQLRTCVTECMDRSAASGM